MAPLVGKFFVRIPCQFGGWMSPTHMFQFHAPKYNWQRASFISAARVYALIGPLPLPWCVLLTHVLSLRRAWKPERQAPPSPHQRSEPHPRSVGQLCNRSFGAWTPWLAPPARSCAASCASTENLSTWSRSTRSKPRRSLQQQQHHRNPVRRVE